ncbi:hypothetical protein [Rarobacter incanus]|uniref:ACT domain-containing protein n=1 Tax=Rarobacter incanus TaxID=153494 RepID=A0A542SNB1_9MICO|nr:hypothetical protein [Rarobacter incanus]TQK76121.1 hypothetical protein FB389_0779 [Rarobacter incanus]
MLGRTSRESASTAWRAAVEGGWLVDETGLLDLGSTTATLQTVGSIAHLAAVVHIGNPSRPDPNLEHALLSSPAGVRIVAARSVPSSWAWVGQSAAASGHTVVDEAGMRDCRHTLRAMGVHPHLVPTAMPVDDRIALAGVDGLLVVERDNVPAGYVDIPGSDQLGGRPQWYGLVRRDGEVRVTEPSRIWLAFGPTADHRGSLHSVLGSVADVGLNLVHLRSHPTHDGPHVFFCAFDVSAAAELDALVGAFRAMEVSHRVIAVLPRVVATPDPSALEPVWLP